MIYYIKLIGRLVNQRTKERDYSINTNLTEDELDRVKNALDIKEDKSLVKFMKLSLFIDMLNILSFEYLDYEYSGHDNYYVKTLIFKSKA